jgi:hypothetical protein
MRNPLLAAATSLLATRTVQASCETLFSFAYGLALTGRAHGKRARRLRPRASPRRYLGLRRRKPTLEQRAQYSFEAAAVFGKTATAACAALQARRIELGLQPSPRCLQALP